MAIQMFFLPCPFQEMIWPLWLEQLPSRSLERWVILKRRDWLEFKVQPLPLLMKISCEGWRINVLCFFKSIKTALVFVNSGIRCCAEGETESERKSRRPDSEARQGGSEDKWKFRVGNIMRKALVVTSEATLSAWCPREISLECPEASGRCDLIFCFTFWSSKKWRRVI